MISNLWNSGILEYWHELIESLEVEDMAGLEGVSVKATFREKNILREDSIEKVIVTKDKISVDNRQNSAKHTILGTEENASLGENTLAEDDIPENKGSLEKDDNQVNSIPKKEDIPENEDSPKNEDIPKNEDSTVKEDTILMAAVSPDWPLVEAAQVPLSKLTAGTHQQTPLNSEHQTLHRPVPPPKKTAAE